MIKEGIEVGEKNTFFPNIDGKKLSETRKFFCLHLYYWYYLYYYQHLSHSLYVNICYKHTGTYTPKIIKNQKPETLKKTNLNSKKKKFLNSKKILYLYRTFL